MEETFGKISIIIATYNRADHIIKTLESINMQSYRHWECIIVDDGSIDHTEYLVKKYIQDKTRYKFVKRPAYIIKGANSCRNYGFTLCKGVFIKFFDSDDLMLPQHLEILVDIIKIKKLDFAVGDCRNFDENGLRERPYEIDRSSAKLSPINFALFQVAWITNDLLIKREFAEQLRFVEGIRDQASEYQYNIKLLYLTKNGILINKILTHRRIHDDGFVVKAQKDLVKFDQMNAELKLITLIYLECIADQDLQRWLLSGHIQLNFKLALKKILPENISLTIRKLAKYFGCHKAALYPFAILSGYLFGKGYNAIKYIRT